MADYIYNYRDTNLSLYQVNSDYILLLQIYPATFSYAIVYENKLLAWAEDCELHLLNEPGDEHELLSYDYKKMVVALPATGLTLVPNLLYSEEHIGDFARYLDVRANEKVIAQPLDTENRIVYKINDTVAATAVKYDMHKAAYIAKGWINAIADSNPPADNLYVNVDKDHAWILYFAADKLRFYNVFEFHNPDELAYYAAYVAGELQLQPKALNLVISGDINIDDTNAQRLTNFFNGVEQNNLKVIDLPAEVFPHQVLALTALSLCVSSEVF